MNKDELYEAAYKAIFEDTGSLSREEYREFLEGIIGDCEDALNALDQDAEE